MPSITMLRVQVRVRTTIVIHKVMSGCYGFVTSDAEMFTGHVDIIFNISQMNTVDAANT